MFSPKMTTTCLIGVVVRPATAGPRLIVAQAAMPASVAAATATAGKRRVFICECSETIVGAKLQAASRVSQDRFARGWWGAVLRACSEGVL